MMAVLFTHFSTHTRRQPIKWNTLLLCALLLLNLGFCSALQAQDAQDSKRAEATEKHAPNYRVQLFFGLSKPNGGGVSLKAWRNFESQQITRYFEGFNVIDSVGYYQGEAERSKVVTIFTSGANLSNTKTKATALSRMYATQFEQDSVMMAISELEDWQFVSQK